MSLLATGVVVFFFLVLFVPWLLLVSSPLVVLTLSTMTAAGGMRQWLLGVVEDAAEKGVLSVDGLAAESGLEASLRSAIGQALALAPVDRPARACACIRKSESGLVGVVRMFGPAGHHLFRVSADTAAAAVARIEADLSAMTKASFTAASTLRKGCPECDASTCPLRLLRQGLVQQAIA